MLFNFILDVKAVAYTRFLTVLYLKVDDMGALSSEIFKGQNSTTVLIISKQKSCKINFK